MQTMVAEAGFQALRSDSSDREGLDLVIVGAGVAGLAAALEARKQGLRFVVLEATEPFSTIVNFPKGKPIYTYPTDMKPAGSLQLRANVKDRLHQGAERRVAETRGADQRGGP